MPALFVAHRSPGCDCEGMKRPVLALALSLALLSPVIGSAFGQPVVTLPPFSTVTFAPGSTTATVTGQVAAGGRALYYVPAKAGQTLSVSIASPAAGPTFQVFSAEATLAKGADGSPAINGRTLPDAGPGDNAKAWIGAIPRDGNYLVVVVAPAVGSPTVPTPYALTVALQ